MRICKHSVEGWSPNNSIKFSEVGNLRLTVSSGTIRSYWNIDLIKFWAQQRMDGFALPEGKFSFYCLCNYTELWLSSELLQSCCDVLVSKDPLPMSCTHRPYNRPYNTYVCKTAIELIRPQHPPLYLFSPIIVCWLSSQYSPQRLTFPWVQHVEYVLSLSASSSTSILVATALGFTHP